MEVAFAPKAANTLVGRWHKTFMHESTISVHLGHCKDSGPSAVHKNEAPVIMYNQALHFRFIMYECNVFRKAYRQSISLSTHNVRVERANVYKNSTNRAQTDVVDKRTMFQ